MEVRLLGVDLDALAGEMRRRRGELGQRHRSEPLERRREPRAVPGTPHEAAPTLKTCGGASKSTATGTSSDSALDATRPGHLDEEVEQRRVPPGRVDEHEAARPEARQRALGGERRQHRGDGGIDRVAALAQRPSAPGLGGH